MALWISTEKTGSDSHPIIRQEKTPTDLDTEKKLCVLEDRVLLFLTGRSIDPMCKSSSSSLYSRERTVIKKLYNY